MLRFLEKFLFVPCVFVAIFTNPVFGEGNSCASSADSYCAKLGAYDVPDCTSSVQCAKCSSNDAEQHRYASCGYGSFSCKDEYIRKVVRSEEFNGGVTVDMFSCKCADNQYEYAGYAVYDGEYFECKPCPDKADWAANKIKLCGKDSEHDGYYKIGQIIGEFECLDGYTRVVNANNDGYECVCGGENEYLYEDTNGYKTCKMCPDNIVTDYDEDIRLGITNRKDVYGIAACGRGEFSCKKGFMLSRSNDDDKYMCADCHFFGTSTIKAWLKKSAEDDDDGGIERLCSFEPNCSTDNCFGRCYRGNEIIVNLGENCVATLTADGRDYGRCNVIQTYSTNMEYRGNYETNVTESNNEWSVVTSFIGAAPGVYFENNGTSDGLCKLCTGNTYSYGGTYVDACFTEPNNATMVSSGDVNVGFTCNNAGTFKNGNALCQSCPVAMGTNNTPMNVTFDSTKTGIEACYINAGQTFKNEHGTLKISNACYARPETAGGTVKFCVTSNTCAEKLAEAVSDIVNVNADSLKTICNSQNTNWANLPSDLNDYIDILETVGCMQWYVDYDIQN